MKSYLIPVLILERSIKLKDGRPNLEKLVYERAVYICKAGKENASKSSGLRETSTNRQNCPFKLRIGLQQNKISIKEINCVHENHNCDRQTFLHYTESMRLTKDEELYAKNLIICGANKQKVKANLMAKRDAPVPMKT